MATLLNASYISILQRGLDLLSIFLSLFLIFKLNNLSLNNEFLVIFLTLALIFQIISSLSYLYKVWQCSNLFKDSILILENIACSIIVLYFFNFLFLEKMLSLVATIELLLLLSMVFLLSRAIIRVTYYFIIRISSNNTTMNSIVIGDTPRAKKLFQDLTFPKRAKYPSIELFSFQDIINDPDYTGNIDTAIEKIRSGTIEKVYIVIDSKNIQKIESLIKLLSDTTCSAIIIPDLFQLDFLCSTVQDINGTPAIPLFETRMNGINIFLKRIEDLIFSIIILIIISPILLIISVAIKINSKGPVFFKQCRHGLNGKPITVYKFRTMSVMENGCNIKQATKNDTRVTSVGRFLRKTSLDELPQFFNVIEGSMSIVGPRPHALAHNEMYRNIITGYMLRHKVKPGITGLAQIRGWRGETDTLDKMAKRVECDLEYIRTWNILLDIRIIFLTIFKGFIHKAAY